MMLSPDILSLADFKPVLLHLVNARFGDFYAGFFHVITAMEHVLPILALGLFTGQQSQKSGRRALVVFGFALLLGVTIGTNIRESDVLFYICILSLILMGGLVTIQWKIPVGWLLILAGFIGLTQGLANGSSLENGIKVLNYVSGVSMTGIIIFTLFSGLALSFLKYWQKIAIRVLGSWIAAMGIIYLPFLIMNMNIN